MQTDTVCNAVGDPDGIIKYIYSKLKPCGFRKHGCTLHRFVSGDISQLVNFQSGQAYRGESNLLFVNVGIRVPECMNRSFRADEKPKKYYHEYECNIRSRLGEIEGKPISCYDLLHDSGGITDDILRQIEALVLPFFDALNSREAILARRREFPQFDLVNAHLILLDEAMIYGHLGDTNRAAETFNEYYRLFQNGMLAQKDPGAIRNHIRYLDGLAAELGIEIK